MIVNYLIGFLFLHIQKTAGTSIKKNLLQEEGTGYLHYPHTMIRDANLTTKQQQLFKFLFVSNLWDRLFSWYSMIVRIGTEKTFFNYIHGNCHNFSGILDLTDVIIDDPHGFFKTNVPNVKSIAFNQLDYLTDRFGKLNVDFIGRFEYPEEENKFDFKTLTLRSLPLHHPNMSTSADYRKFDSSEDVDKVYKMYHIDIEYFGFKF